MPTLVTVADVISRGVVIGANEAVAIAQLLIEENPAPFNVQPPLGPPRPASVVLGRDGTVWCRGCAATPAVSEIGALLDTMLPRGGAGRASGALRYTIARALLEVDAPPFDGVPDLAATLRRHERGDRRALVRGLLERYDAALDGSDAAAVISATPFRERRRTTASSAELRRHLRDADRRLFELAAAARSESTAPVHPSRRIAVGEWFAAAAAIVMSFTTSYVATRELTRHRAESLRPLVIEAHPIPSPATALPPLVDRTEGAPARQRRRGR
jgi:hypothetical protein